MVRPSRSLASRWWSAPTTTPDPFRNCSSDARIRSASKRNSGQSGSCQFQRMIDKLPFYQSRYSPIMIDKAIANQSVLSRFAFPLLGWVTRRQLLKALAPVRIWRVNLCNPPIILPRAEAAGLRLILAVSRQLRSNSKGCGCWRGMLLRMRTAPRLAGGTNRKMNRGRRCI